MSALVHCDGPECTTTREADLGRLPRSVVWIRVKAEPNAFPLDFCSKACLVGWADVPAAEPRPVGPGRPSPRRMFEDRDF